MTPTERFTYLQSRYLNQLETEAERTELYQLLLENTENEEWQTVLQGIAESEPVDKQYDERRWEPAVHFILGKQNQKPVTVHRIQLLKTAWFRYAAAIVLIAGVAGIVYMNNKPGSLAITPQAHKVSDVVPGGNKAILTLADGTTIMLDSAGTGSIAMQGNTKILKKDAAEVAYESGGDTGVISYNTLTTPNGGQYRIILPDGTKVWLNAASQMRFPTVFRKDRIIEITGEAYLEVANDKNKPFLVRTGKTEVEVLGTSFNVNAYTNEAADKISLAAGSIKIGNHLLKPGQAYVAGGVDATDIEQDLAWKDGFFNFKQSQVTSIMRELERWYDVQVVYAGSRPASTFTGILSKKTSLPTLLKILDDIGVNCQLEGRKIIVKS